MNPPLGFILLSHDKPRQAQRLVNRLNVMFDFPPIVWHHDFSRCPLTENHFPANISFVRPPVKTHWTEFSVSEAEIKAMEQLLALPAPPDRFILLSGTDYPIKPARKILSDLSEGDFDAHIFYELVREDRLESRTQMLSHRRHMCFNFPPPPLFRWMKRRWPIATFRYRGPFRWLSPFSRELECYAGNQWFVANLRVARYLCDYHRTKPKLARYYRRSMFADESYFHTIMLNAGQFKVNNNQWRYMDWSSGSAHPKTLGMEDLPKLLASRDHFARKFDMNVDAEILDRLDEVTGGV